MPAPTIEVWRYQRELTRHARNAKTSWAEREGAVVRLTTPAGEVGYGELAPLPGYSPDTLEDCLQALSAHASLPLELEPAAFAAWCQHRWPRLPALICALDTAYLDAVARQRGVPARALLCLEPTPGSPEASRNGTAESDIALTAQLDPMATGVAVCAERAWERGVTTFKLKLGPRDGWYRQLAVAQGFRARFGTEARLRFDANQSFDRATAASMLSALAELEPEFVEEPTPLPFPDPGECPLALDESLAHSDPSEWDELLAHHVRAVCLKPTTLGGPHRTLELARRARQRGIATIVSHTFESSLGFGVCCELALALNSPEFAAGLDWQPALWPDLSIRGLGANSLSRSSTTLGFGVQPSGREAAWIRGCRS